MNLSIDTDSVSLNAIPPNSTRRRLLEPIPNCPGEFLFVIDNSSLEKFSTCPKSAEYYLYHGRESHGKKAALEFGTAIHIALELLERGASTEEQNAALVQFYTEHPSSSNDYRSLPVALEVMAHYRVRRMLPDYDWQVQSDDKGLIIERPFETPMGVIEVNSDIRMPWLTNEEFARQTYNGHGLVHVSNIHVAWSGRIDLVAYCNGRVRGVDNKTTSQSGDNIVQEYNLASQTLGYTWHLQQAYPDLDITGFCMNFIHLKSPGMKDGSVKTSYDRGLMDAGPRGGKGFLDFFRAYFDYTPSRIKWWHQNTLLQVSHFISSLVHGEWEQRTKWCFNKYGRCPYYDVCLEDSPTMALAILNSEMYRPVTWNPTADR